MPTADEIRACVAVLEAVRQLDPDHPDYVAVEQAAAHLNKTAKKKRRKARRQARAAANAEALGNSGRAASYRGVERRDEVSPELRGTKICYACKERYRVVDEHYQALCEKCADDHRAHLAVTADLGGRRALVTGGRIKIGFESALRLLRNGCEVTITTRFPTDALARYRAEVDSESWIDRLRIVGLDFRDIRGLLGWIETEAAGEPIDILINNAAQTIRRAPAYYAALADAELKALTGGGPIVVAENAREALTAFHHSCVGLTAPTFPIGRLDAEGLQLDLSTQNSWTKTLAEVGPVELLETHLVTAVAPFLLCAGFKALMERSPHRPRFVVNASAMEGVFYYSHKTTRHPHTNMAKAAVNMLTRTSAADFAKSDIHMVAVDTGWITDENPEHVRQRTGFCPPLEARDGAARLLHPIFAGIAGEPISGVFLKNFGVAKW